MMIWTIESPLPPTTILERFGALIRDEDRGAWSVYLSPYKPQRIDGNEFSLWIATLGPRRGGLHHCSGTVRPVDNGSLIEARVTLDPEYWIFTALFIFGPVIALTWSLWIAGPEVAILFGAGWIAFIAFFLALARLADRARCRAMFERICRAPSAKRVWKTVN